MKRIGVREFKDHATSYLASGETLVIERHGEAVGFFVPIEAKDREAGRASLGRLSALVEDVLATSGTDEDELVHALTKRRRRSRR